MDQTSHTATRPADGSRVAVVVIASAAFITSLAQALVVPVLPSLPDRLAVSASAASWLVTITVILGAVANPLLSRLGDRHGRKQLLLASIGAFVVGSVICAVTDEFAVLLVGRAVQGLSTASIPLGIGLIAGIVEPSRRSSGIALVSATLGVGGAAGLPLAGVLTAGWGLPGVFWASAAVGALALIATTVLVPEASTAPHRGRTDLLGTALLAIALAAALVPLSQGTTWGWTSPATLGLFALAAITLVGFVRWELRTRDPVVDIRLAACRPILLTNLVGVLLGIGFFISFLSTITLLQLPESSGGFGRSIVQAGVLVLPSGAAMAVLAPMGGRIVSRHGARSTLLIACGSALLGFVVFATARTELWQLVLSAVVVWGGVSMAYAAMPALIIDLAPPPQSAAASGINALARNLGSASGSAVFGLFAGATAPSTSESTTLGVVGAATAAAALLVALTLPRVGIRAGVPDPPDEPVVKPVGSADEESVYR
ncbi:MFS transporter [Streptomyces pilosus]|uniref:MFS transporter n=1 Tax=Streptomyces pilosus TaxID=28893 RepID=UPI0036451348